MKVTVAAAGRFHAIRLAQELEKRTALAHLFTASIVAHDYAFLAKDHVTHFSRCAFIDLLYLRLKLNRFIRPSTVYLFKDALFGRACKRQLLQNSPSDIFVGWAHYCFESIPVIKEKSKIFILESGSAHIQAQGSLLLEEYKRAGISYPPVCEKQQHRMITEYRAADYIMTPSLFVKNSFLKQGISESKLLRIACGADLAFFTPTQQELELVTARRLDHKKNYTVLFVGLICLRKGIRLLLESWQLVKQEHQGAHLVLVGALMPDARAVLLPALHDKSIEYVGAVSREKLRDYYAQADIFVLPSLEDGFGMVAGEAMALSLPVIVTDHTGVVDCITDGQEGYIVPAGDHEKLAQAILSLGESETRRLSMGDHARKKSTFFSWDRYGQETYNLYKQLLGVS